MRRIYTISSKNSRNTYFHVLQMTRNFLGVKKQNKFPKIKFWGVKNAETHKYPNFFPKTYMILTPAYNRFKRTLVSSKGLK